MSGVFISYRRDDSRGSAGRLYDDLSDRFGRDLVFRDLDTVQPGAVYGQIIDAAISRCDAVIVVMGDQWIDARDADGRRRLDKPDDLVRTEVASALARDKIVIPVLVEDARMPTEAELPSELRAMASRNALPISDHRWDYDVSRLVGQLEQMFVARPGHVGEPTRLERPARYADPAGPPAPPASEPRSPQMIPILAAIVLVSVALGGFLIGRNTGGDSAPANGRVVDAGSGPTGATGRAEAIGPREEAGSTAPVASAGGGSSGPAGTIPIAIGDTVENGKPPGAGNIASPGMKQTYTFTASAGQILYLRSLPDSSPELGWRLYAPSGAEVSGHLMSVDIGRVKLTADGPHTIEVSGSGSATGAYGFSVMAVPPDAKFALVLGVPVENGKPPAAGNIAAPGAKQIYTFVGTAGQSLYLKSLPDSSPELRWRLYSPSGAEVSGHLMNIDIGRVKLTANGPHTIEVSGSGSATGTYGFLVTAVA